MLGYHIRHGVHKIAYQCENGVCEHSPEFIAIEILGRLSGKQIIRRQSEQKESSHASSI